MPTTSSWQHAGDALLMTVLGGVHQFLGPLWGAIAFILLQDRLSAITESWWLMFAPIVILFALASPEGMQGLVFRAAAAASDWTLVRRGIPPRPARIAPFRDGGAAHHAIRSADPDSARPAQAIWLAGRGRGREPRRASVPAAQPDRPERRRQDDVLQHADRAAAAQMPDRSHSTAATSRNCRCIGASVWGLAARSRSSACSAT